MILSNYFSTPIWEDILPLDYNSIVEKVLARKHTSDGRIISNLGGWQSDHINIDFPDLYKSVDRMLKLVGDQIGGMELNFCQGWFNVNSGDDYNKLHVHPMSTLSGVLYLKVDDDSGHIVFQNPVSAMEHYPFNPIENKIIYSGISCKPEVGKIIIFPSWLAHMVQPSNSNEQRISFSFNYIQKNLI
jgi:uncharacterized protein (TIGR02466 family)